MPPSDDEIFYQHLVLGFITFQLLKFFTMLWGNLETNIVGRFPILWRQLFGSVFLQCFAEKLNKISNSEGILYLSGEMVTASDIDECPALSYCNYPAEKYWIVCRLMN